MEIKDIIFEPHNDMSVDDINIVTKHKNLINQNKYSDATDILDSNGYSKGFRASLFNSIQNKIRTLQSYLLNEYVTDIDSYISDEEPDSNFMEENGYKFWLKPY